MNCSVCGAYIGIGTCSNLPCIQQLGGEVITSSVPLNVKELAEDYEFLLARVDAQAATIDKQAARITEQAELYAQTVGQLEEVKEALQAENDTLSRSLYDMNLELLKMDELRRLIPHSGEAIVKICAWLKKKLDI